MKTIVIGCDNAAVELKNTIMGLVEQLGYAVENVGCDSSDDPTNYPTIAKRVCERIIESGYEKNGILVCGTGIGMAMTANKFKGIQCSVYGRPGDRPGAGEKNHQRMALPGICRRQFHTKGTGNQSD